MYKAKPPMRCAMLVGIGLAVAGVAGCQKLGQPANVPERTTIPASFGDLVAVTPAGTPFDSVLWFKQADQTIVAVHVNIANGQTHVYTTRYPRS